MSKQFVYMDYAAATPMDPAVVAAMQPYFTDIFYNPSAMYLAAKQAARDVGQARTNIASILGCKPSEIIFTAGGTEANNLAISGIMKQYPGSEVVVSAIEHESVLQSAEQYKTTLATVDKYGLVDLVALKRAISDKTVLVSIMYANNEVGTIQPIRQIAEMINELQQNRKKDNNNLPLFLHTDACQAPAYLDIHTSRLGVDMMTLNAGKIYGPKQCGLLFVRTGMVVQPQILGGGQERNMRSGTENVAAVVGMAKALELVQQNRKNEVVGMQQLHQLFIKELTAKIPQAIINGSTKQRLPNNIHLTLPGHDNERLMMELDERGIACAVGSACSASNEEPSHVLAAMGLTVDDIQASLRFTMGKHTTQNDIKTVVDTLAAVIA